MLVAILLGILAWPQTDFIQFRYCREFSRGPFEMQCVELRPDGEGPARFKKREAEEVEGWVSLSPSSRERFLSVLAGTKYLADAERYESRRNVADLGRKVLVLETAAGLREAQFNYSDLKEVNALAQFFDALLNQQTVVFDLETAIQIERLSVPRHLERIEAELRANRIADPRGLIPVLEKVEQDSRIVNYAREHARRLKERVER